MIRAKAYVVFLLALLVSIAGCRSQQPKAPHISLRVQAATQVQGDTRYPVVWASGRGWVPSDVLFDVNDVSAAELDSEGVLWLLLTQSAGRRMQEVSETYVERPILVFVNDDLACAPNVNTPLGRRFIIQASNPGFDRSLLRALESQINAKGEPLPPGETVKSPGAQVCEPPVQ